MFIFIQVENILGNPDQQTDLASAVPGLNEDSATLSSYLWFLAINFYCEQVQVSIFYLGLVYTCFLPLKIFFYKHDPKKKKKKIIS